MGIDVSNVVITTVGEDPDTGETVTIVDDIETERIAPPPERVVQRDLQAKSRAAIEKNKTFLAITTPTNAEAVAQIKLLTRENTALIKLLLNHFEDSAGT